MDYTRLVVFANLDSLELVADAMWQVANGGVEIFEGNPKATLIDTCGWDYIDEGSIYMQNEKPYCACVINSEMADEAIGTILSIVNSQYGIGIQRNDIIKKEIAQIDWENAWKDNYQVVKAGHFSIVPIWLFKGKKTKKTILINPSIGFGTGQHESTAIALELLDRMTVKDKDVLDIGTGSGILGIAAAVSGAKNISMLDYDKGAVDNAQENIQLNNIDANLDLYVHDVIKHPIAGEYDIILANLTADILIQIVERIRAVSKNGTRLILSGILTTKWQEVSVVYRSLGFKIKRTLTRGEWTGAVLYM